jgi:hypothetical protein
MPFRLSKKVTLNEGDKVRVSGGPYYVTKDGKKIGMGEHGTGTFVGVVDEKGAAIYVRFGTGIAKFVYIGPEYVSDTTGTIMRPHKIVKIRK